MNHNGVMDGNDYAIAGAKVSLTQAGSNTPLATVYSGSDGSYHFNNLDAGTFSVKMETPSNLPGQDNGSEQMVLDKDGNIISVGTAGTAVQDAYSNISLDDGQTGLNFNIAEAAYPVTLISARMLLSSAARIPHTSGVAVPGTNATSDSILSFGNVLVGTPGSTTLTVTNLGGQGSTLSGTFPGASGEFGSAGTSTFGPLDSGQEASQDYTYTPTARGASTQDITVTSNVGNVKVTLSGTGVAPVSSVTQSDAGYALVGSTDGYGKHHDSERGRREPLGPRRRSAISRAPFPAARETSPAPAAASVWPTALRKPSATPTHPRCGGDGFGNHLGKFYQRQSRWNQHRIHDRTSLFPARALHRSSRSILRAANAGLVRIGTTGTASVTVNNVGDGNLSGLGEMSNLNGTVASGSGNFSGSGGSVSLADNAAQDFQLHLYTDGSHYRFNDYCWQFSNGSADGTNLAETVNAATQRPGRWAHLLQRSGSRFDAGLWHGAASRLEVASPEHQQCLHRPQRRRHGADRPDASQCRNHGDGRGLVFACGIYPRHRAA